MFRKLGIGLGTVALAATVAAAPATAVEADAKPAADVASVVENVKPDTHADKLGKAELTGKHLDNAKKGVESAKGIADTLSTLGGLFGLGGK